MDATARTPHSHMVSIWRQTAILSKGAGKSLARLQAYLGGEAFAASFAALDPARRLLALQAAADAIARFDSKPPAPVAEGVRWTPEMQERIRDAARRLPDDRAIAREL